MGDILGVKVSIDAALQGFEVDSRNIQKGYVFFALKGKKVDGHDFIREAAARGAICAFVSEDYLEKIESIELIRVKDVLGCLHKLAAWKMSQNKSKCIAVTGSVGKTTTKEFLATLLEGSFKVQKTPGNANSQTGFPLSILNAQEKGEVFIAEMGMSAFGEIKALVEIAPPDFVIVTKIALAHAAFFPNGLEDIALAKSEILSHPRTKKAFINAQARQFKAFQGITRPSCVFYGLAEDPSIRREDAKLLKNDRNFSIQREDELLVSNLTLPFEASHFCENFLGVALVAKELGMDFKEIEQRAQKLTSYSMRFERVEKEGVVYINDAYNANAESMKAALCNLPIPAPKGKVIAALGEMRELGRFSEEAHREIGREAARAVDLLLCLAGDTSYMAEEFSSSGKPFYYFSDIQELKKRLLLETKKGDVVLIKASKSLKMWTLLEDDD